MSIENISTYTLDDVRITPFVYRNRFVIAHIYIYMYLPKKICKSTSTKTSFCVPNGRPTDQSLLDSLLKFSHGASTENMFVFAIPFCKTPTTPQTTQLKQTYIAYVREGNILMSHKLYGDVCLMCH